MKTQSQVCCSKESFCCGEGNFFQIPSRVRRSEGALCHSEDVRQGEDTIYCGKDKIYVCILVLSQSKLLSHNS